MQKANNAGETADVNNFKHKLEQNNKDLRQTAENALESSDSNKVKHAINEEIMPLITTEIKDLNKAEIKDGYVNDARKNAIEMYYSLQNYYETREETIENSEKLKRIDYDKLPQEGKDIEQFDKTFDKRYSELKHSYN